MSSGTPAAAPAAAQIQSTEAKTDSAEKTETKSADAKEEPQKPSKLKIKNIELDEESAFREIQRGRQATRLLSEAQKRASQAEEKEKAHSERIGRYKSDLGEFFKDQGFDSDTASKLASEWLYKNVIEPQEMSGEQRKIRELESKLREQEELKRQDEEAKKKSEQEKVTLEQAKQIEGELIQAMESGVLPRDREIVSYVSAEMLKFAERDIEIPIEQAVKLAEEKLGRLGGKVIAQMAASDDPGAIDQLATWMGKENFNRFAVKLLKWASGKASANQQKSNPVQAQPTSAPRRKMTPQEFYELQRQKGLK